MHIWVVFWFGWILAFLGGPAAAGQTGGPASTFSSQPAGPPPPGFLQETPRPGGSTGAKTSGREAADACRMDERQRGRTAVMDALRQYLLRRPRVAPGSPGAPPLAQTPQGGRFPKIIRYFYVY